MWVARLQRRESGLGNLRTAYFNEDWAVISSERWQEVVADFFAHQRAVHPESALTEVADGLSDI